MNVRNLRNSALVLGLVVFAAAGLTSAPGKATDPILASFERELNHEPARTAPVARKDIDADELYRRLDSVHWTDAGEAMAMLDECQRLEGAGSETGADDDVTEPALLVAACANSAR